MENQSLKLENVQAMCFSCIGGEHDECMGCDCGDSGHYASNEAID